MANNYDLFALEWFWFDFAMKYAAHFKAKKFYTSYQQEQQGQLTGCHLYSESFRADFQLPKQRSPTAALKCWHNTATLTGLLLVCCAIGSLFTKPVNNKSMIQQMKRISSCLDTLHCHIKNQLLLMFISNIDLSLNVCSTVGIIYSLI